MAEIFGRSFTVLTGFKWERQEVGTSLGPHYSLENLVFICEITPFHAFYKNLIPKASEFIIEP